MEVKGYMGSVSFDGSTVTVAKKMRGSQQIPLSAVSAVAIENAGVGMRAIRFSVAGGTLRGASVVLGSHKDFANDPFALTFRKAKVSEFEALCSEIATAISA